jgi:hypothetical protein
MAVDFGLLNSGAQIPLHAKAPEPLDVAGSANRAYSIAGKATELGERQRELGSADADRKVLQEAMQGGADFNTPDGLQKTLKDVEGKLSPDAYMRLSAHTQKTQQIYNQMQEFALKKTGQEREAYMNAQEQMMPMVGQLVDFYHKTASEKGEPAAQEAVKGGRAALGAQLAAQKLPSGQPMYPPEIIKTLTEAPWEQVEALYQSSPTRNAAVKNVHAEAQVRELDARAKREELISKAMEGGGEQGWKPLVTPEGQMVRVASKGQAAGQVQTQGPDGTWSNAASMPVGARHVGDKGSGAQTGPDVLSDSTIDAITQYTTVNGKPPAVPGLGNGAAAASAKTRILNHWADSLAERGISAVDAGANAALRDSSKAALATLTKQDATIRAGISNVSSVFDKLIKDVAELGGPDSPKLRAVWNKAATDWAGDSTFVKVNQDILDLQESGARVFSGQSGAGGTSKAFLDMGKKLADAGWSLEQVVAASKNFKSLSGIREKAVDAEKKEIVNAMRGGAEPAGSKVAPETQAARDTDSKKILMTEYDRLVKSLDGLTGPAKERKMADIREMRKELKDKKIDVPEPGKTSDEWTERKLPSGVTVRVRIKQE